MWTCIELLHRPPGDDALPDESAVSVLSLAELEIGVLLAATADERSRRLALLEQVREVFDPLPVDESVARAYARLVAAAREAGLNPRVIDTLIGATSRAHGLVLHTRDRNQAALPGVETVLVAVG